MHEMIIRKYIGIGRRDVEKFLKTQLTTQLKHVTFSHDKGHGISIGSFPGHIVEIYLLFMDKADKHLNMMYKYICIMLDRFSGKVGACPLKKKTRNLY